MIYKGALNRSRTSTCFSSQRPLCAYTI